MRKYFIVAISIAVLIGIAACKSNTPTATLSLSTATLQLKVGDMSTIETSGTATNIEWSSSDEEVATVYYGVVTAKSIGKTVVKAFSGDVFAECIVYVSGTDGATLRISPALVSVNVGETYQFSYGNTYDLELTWSSSDAAIASVNETGLVTANKPGNVVITLATPVESVEAVVAVAHKWGEYKLVWSDEFNGTELDESVWNYNTGGNGWGNNEKQYYTKRAENIRVQNGCLEIEGRKEQYENNEYTSARIHSKGKKDFKYGRVESRIKFPGGKGTWPAFWMLGAAGNWPNCGEIDIIEHVGSLPKRASFALHTAAKNGTRGNNWSQVQWFDNPLEDDFHVYGIEWAQEEKDGKDVIRFTVDGVQYAESWEGQIDNNDTWPFNKAHYIIFNFAIGGNMGGTIDDAIFDTQRIMYVDWVRVYQRSEE